MTRSIQLLFSTFWSPETAVDSELTKRQLQFLVFCLLTYYLVLLVWTLSMGLELALKAAPETEIAREILTAQFWKGGVILLAGLIVATVIWWYAVAVFLAGLNLFGTSRNVPFRRFLILAILGSVYLFFRDGFVFLILKLKGTEAIRSLEDLQAPIGLDLLLGEPGTFWWRLLGFVNMFEVATVAFLSYGFHRITGASLGFSTFGVGLLWVVWSVVRALIGTFFGPGI